MVKRLALANPSIGIELYEHLPQKSPRQILRFDAETELFDGRALSRLGRTVGKEFPGSSVWIDAKRDEITLNGHISLPTYTRGTASSQFCS